MCGQSVFHVRDNVATFVGWVEVGCLPGIGITPPGEVDQLRAYVADRLRKVLRDGGYRTGEGRVTVTGGNGLLHHRVRATIHAEGPKADLYLGSFMWPSSRAVFTQA